METLETTREEPKGKAEGLCAANGMPTAALAGPQLKLWS